jgi:hypothetical protein
VFIDGSEPRRQCDHCTREYTLRRAVPDVDDFDALDEQIMEEDDH